MKNGEWENEMGNKKWEIVFNCFFFLFIMQSLYFSTVIIDIHVLFQKHSGVNLRNAIN